MDDIYVIPERYKRGRIQKSCVHHFQVEVVLSLIDQMLLELDDRFDEMSKALIDQMCVTINATELALILKHKAIMWAKL